MRRFNLRTLPHIANHDKCMVLQGYTDTHHFISNKAIELPKKPK